MAEAGPLKRIITAIIAGAAYLLDKLKKKD